MRNIEDLPPKAKMLLDGLSELLLELKRRQGTVDLALMQIPSSAGIPLSEFDHDISPLESLVLFMHDHQGLSEPQIAVALARHRQTIATTLRFARKRAKVSFPEDRTEQKILQKIGVISKSQIEIPSAIFADRKLTVLEHVSVHLSRNYGLRNSEIARLLHRDPRTIWTILNRARGKQKDV